MMGCEARHEDRVRCAFGGTDVFKVGRVGRCAELFLLCSDDELSVQNVFDD